MLRASHGALSNDQEKRSFFELQKGAADDQFYLSLSTLIIFKARYTLLSRKEDALFEVKHLRVGLKERALRSTGVTLVAQAAKLLVQIASIAILARLLEPADFGLVAMVTVFTGLALQLMEGGLSVATVQREHVTHAQVSNLFWVNAGLGLTLSLLVTALAPLVAWLYQEPRLSLVMSAMGLMFLIGGLSVQHDALLKRQMRFGALAMINVVSMVAGVAASILAALSSFGYWALVVNPIVTFLVQTFMRWWSVRWVPSLMSRGSGTRSLLAFGANLTGAQFVGYLATSLTPFAIGYIGGAQPLGWYNRANALTSIPASQVLPPVMSVMQPALARVADEPESLRRAILSVIGKIALAAMFVTLTMAVLADWFVVLFLGAGWEDAVAIFRMLAVFSLVEPVAAFTVTTLVAVGKARAVLRWKTITLIILVASISVGAYWGVHGVVAAYALSGVLVRLPLFLAYASRYLPVSLSAFARALVPAMICAVVTIAGLLWLRSVVHVNSPLAGLLIFVPAAAVLYTSLCLLITPTRIEFLDGWSMMRSLLNRKLK